jgi:hypothetical protein
VPERFSPGATYPIRVILTHPGMAAAGFQLTSRFTDDGRQAGSLTRAPSDSSRVAITISHNIAYAHQLRPGSAPAARDTASWSLLWTAPATGSGVSFHAAANAADGDNTTDGDVVHTTSATSSGQAATNAPAQLDLTALAWRNLGPFRGGRVSAVAGTAAEPTTFYMGSAGGGIYKTTNAGSTWRNVSDGFVKTGSVGAIAVAPSNANIVYAGMGEHTARANTVHHGDGIYKSTDAGRTWRHIGLAPTQVIARIRVHPRNPDIVYVAAQGALYAPTEERGIYKSTDGGQTWSACSSSARPPAQRTSPWTRPTRTCCTPRFGITSARRRKFAGTVRSVASTRAAMAERRGRS